MPTTSLRPSNIPNFYLTMQSVECIYQLIVRVKLHQFGIRAELYKIYLLYFVFLRLRGKRIKLNFSYSSRFVRRQIRTFTNIIPRTISRSNIQPRATFVPIVIADSLARGYQYVAVTRLLKKELRTSFCILHAFASNHL
jgi:hypothetical protein